MILDKASLSVFSEGMKEESLFPYVIIIPFKSNTSTKY